MGINFFKGHPTESLLPSKAITEAVTKLLTGPRDFDLGKYMAVSMCLLCVSYM